MFKLQGELVVESHQRIGMHLDLLVVPVRVGGLDGLATNYSTYYRYHVGNMVFFLVPHCDALFQRLPGVPRSHLLVLDPFLLVLFGIFTLIIKIF